MPDGSDLLAKRRRELERRLAELSPTKRASVERAWVDDGPGAPISEERPRTIRPRDPAAPAPMSFAQELFWLLERASPGHGYNVPRASRFRGALNTAALQEALDTVVMRHEVLRTTYAIANDKPVQLIQPATAVPVDRLDLRGWPAGEREAEAKREVRERSRRPFDLATDLQLRVTLMTLAEDDHVLLLESHHVASDAWSHNILLREIAALYRSYSARSPSTLAPIAVRYGDFAAWQREHFTAACLEPLLAYWRRRLAGAPARLDLPTDRPRGAGISFDGATRSAVFGPELLGGLRRMSREQNVTLFMTLLAAFDVFLARICGQDDIVVGSPIAGRTLGDTEGIIGYFANMLILRDSVADDPTFNELLGRVRETALGAFDHQEIPFETLVMELSRDHTIARGIPFNVMFTLQDVELESLHLEGTTFTPFGSNRGATKFDLSLFARETAEGLRVAFEFRTDLFDTPTIDRMLDQLHVLLAAIVANADGPVSRLPLLSAAGRAETFARWNKTDAAFPSDVSLGALLGEQAARTPAAVALEAEDADGHLVRLTYAELDGRAASLASRLRGMGVGPGVGVAICAERTPLLVVALLAVLKSGGYYIPLDPEYPADRVAFMLESAAPRVLVTTRALLDLLEPAFPATDVRDHDGATALLLLDDRDHPESPTQRVTPGAGPEDLAYVIYTSGSTGRPKGVMIPNRAVVNYLTWMQREYPLSGADAVLQKAPASFDACIWEFFLPLATGARLVLARPGGHQDPVYILDAIGRHDVTVLQLVPSQLAMILESGGAESAVALRRLRQLFLGGEALPPELLTRLRSRCPDLAVANLYGPTEATVYSTHWSVPMGNWNEAEVPIGRPIANTRIYVLDKRMEPTPLGVPGELCISGAGVARGYLNRPDLTVERFVADQFTSSAGALMYRTGDRARWGADGALRYMGRLDTQIKLRGFRIELGEIEYALVQEPEVQSAVAVMREDTPGDQRLVAYCVSAPGGATQHAALTTVLRERLRQALPEYMIPSAVVWLETLPLNANGKLDRSALPVPDAAARAIMDVYVEPRTALEREIADVWEALLGVKNIGVNDDFFDLGGNSLLALRMIAEVERTSGRKFQLRWLLEHRRIAEIAAVVSAGILDEEERELPVLQRDGPGTPLAFAHGDVLGYGWYCRRLASLLGPAPLIVLPTFRPGPDAPASIEAMASAQVDRLRIVQPHGPYRVGGFCAGGLVALEMARLLTVQGELVESIVMVDSFFANRRFHALEPLVRWLSRGSTPEARVSRRAHIYGRLRYYAWRLASVRRMSMGERLRWAAGLIRRRLAGRGVTPAQRVDIEQVDRKDGAIPESGLGPVGRFVVRAQRAYVPSYFPGHVQFIWASDRIAASSRSSPFGGGWERMVGGFESHVVDGIHSDLVMPHRLPGLAAAIRVSLGPKLPRS